ncbi:hypothetical protein [Paenibacillus sp. JCM 10914]|uniref:NUDIX hydrolase n=1 Tax=Paenibacillus sp. JCM 10914 TaxID=1236974 RepID=UPI0003CC4055|nr:hypothetical protein [Paenibacillus sp. JCM 10914]GAE07454.1 hypothetical protein JCM10914_3684 [Paenibacillus sp. JCM 10914]
MESEVLAVFDGDHRRIGTATRDEVHRQGHWHEAFQCWFIKKEEGIERIYLQLRSTDKKDHPNLLDITAAGHLLATETVMDGIREIQEEIGVDVAYDDLIPLGVQKYTMTKDASSIMNSPTSFCTRCRRASMILCFNLRKYPECSVQALRTSPLCGWVLKTRSLFMGFELIRKGKR